MTSSSMLSSFGGLCKPPQLELMQLVIDRISKLEDALHQVVTQGQQERLQYEARLRNLERCLHSQQTSCEGGGLVHATTLQVPSTGGAEAAPLQDAAHTTRSQTLRSDADTEVATMSSVEVGTPDLRSLAKGLAELQVWHDKVDSRLSEAPPTVTSRIIRARRSFEEKSNEYTLETSMYDCLLILFLEDHDGYLASAVTAGCFGCFVFMMSIFIWVLQSDEFAEDDAKYDHFLRGWRVSDAHSIRMADPLTLTSLVSRACRNDQGLSVGNHQTSMIEGARKYLYRGPALCNVAVLLWALCCALEFRKSFSFLLAVCSFPRSWRAKITYDDEGFCFTEVSPWRFMIGLLSGGMRMLASLVLAYFGSWWLCKTTDLESLLLNASALGFVLDIDDIVFELVAPQEIQMLLAHMKPMKIKMVSIKKAEIYLLLLGILSFMIYANTRPLQSTRTQLEDAIRFMCGQENSYHLVQTTNSMGWVVYTKNARSWTEEDDIPVFDIVSDLIYNPTQGEQYAHEVSSLAEVRLSSFRSVAEVVESYGCRDENSVNTTITTLGKRLSAATHNHSLRAITSCDDARPYCRDIGLVGINVRFMCALTCGCGNPQSGLWDLARAENGCPRTACGNHIRAMNKIAQCKDLSMAELQNTGWQAMVDRMRLLRDITEAQHLNMSSIGCKALATTNKVYICSTSGVSLRFGAAPFCPESCECSSTALFGTTGYCSGMCPTACCQR